MNLFRKILYLTIFATIPVQASNSIQKTVTDWMKNNQVPGVAVELYVQGKPYSYYFGQAQSNTPVNAQTVFELGSLTKLFTCLLIADQVVQGKMDLNQPLSEYISDIVYGNPFFKEMSLKNLGTHTSGLPFNFNETTDPSSFWHLWHPAQPIGSQWAYSNIGIGLLGQALEALLHQDYNQILQERILSPLDMSLIGIRLPANKNLAIGHNTAGQTLPPTQMRFFPSAGAMRASGADMLKFLKAAIGLPGTPEEIHQAMQITQTAYVQLPAMQQGLGWDIYSLSSSTQADLLNPPKEMNLGPLPAKPLQSTSFNGNELIDKTGATDGFRAYIAVIPSRKTGIVILANRYVSNGEIVKIGRTILFQLNHIQ